MNTKNSKKLDEESYKREEKTFFHGSDPEKLKIIQTLVCFVNYRGGELKIFKVKNKSDFKSFFDSANIEKKINSFVEPLISGIIAVKYINNKEGISIKIKASSRFPHFYKKDGCFINTKKEKIFIFQRGSIGIRRSGFNDICNSFDFEQIFKEKLNKIFGSIRDIVIDKPIDELVKTLDNIKKVKMTSYIYDPNNPSAIPVKQIIDTEPFNSINEELNVAVKSWKTNGTFIDKNLIAKAYIKSIKIKNREWIKLLFLSSLEKRMPLCLWSTKLKRNELNKLILDIIKKDSYPSAIEIVRIIPFLQSKKAKKKLNLSISSRYISVQNFAQKILNKINFNTQLNMNDLKNILYPGNTCKITLNNKEVEIDFRNFKKDDLNKVVSAFIDSNKVNKSNLKYTWRLLDLMLYGKQLII